MATDNEQVYNPIEKTEGDRQAPSRDQSAVIYDMLSEGEIGGLVNGMASVFLDGTRLIDEDNWNIYKPKRTADGITCTASNTSITVPNDFSSQYHTTTDGTRHIRIQKALATLAGNGSSVGAACATKGIQTITTTANFFTSAMVASTNSKNGLAPFIRIAGLGPNGTEYVGAITQIVSETEAKVDPPISTAGSHKTISCDYIGQVASFTNSTTLVVSTAPAVSISGGAGQISVPGKTSETFQDFLNFKNVHLNFRTGTKDQLPIARYGEVNTPSASFAITPNEPLKQSDHLQTLSNIPDDYNDTELTSQYDPSEGAAQTTILTATGTGTKAFGCVAPEDIDTVKVVIQFPGGMYAQKIQSESAGEKAQGHAEFQMFFEYSRDGSSYNTVQVLGPTDNEINTRGTSDAVLLANTGMEKAHHAWGPVNFNCIDFKSPNNGYIVTYSKSAFFEEFNINIDKYKPFVNWRVLIKKITADNPLAQDGDWQYQNDSVLYAAEAQVHDWFNYPHSSYSALALNATDFSSKKLPARQYEINGLKCQVPTNYNARYELGSTTEASYTRDISDGSNESTYQNWDGNMRGDATTFNSSSINYNKVWTDNPAWVFYDLLTNKRYGLGEYLESSQIDKYELYQIARYCDELVPNGKGGTEPRFSANLYLTNSQAAFKVMKDFASMFRGILFWHDGKISPTADREKQPIYTFTKGNVKEGLFSYEGTSKKLRTNQVRVTWNNPDNMYRQDVAIVDDTQDIVDRNRVIQKGVVAYGCTSESQAIRYGKWHMLSEKLQKEIVKFSTGVNGIFLKPGDVINVQDADRNRVSFSGRVSSTGTRNTTTVPLDRTVTLASNTNYWLTIISPQSATYLTDTSEASYSGQTFGGHANALDNLSGGSGYNNATYTNIPVTGGTGFDLTVDVTVSSNAVASVSINNKGYGYTDNDDITVTNYGSFDTNYTKATFKINGLASNTTGVVSGDLITFVVSQEGASNLRNTSNIPVQTYFSSESRVEKQPVTTAAGQVSSLTVSPAFTTTPDAESIYALVIASTTSGDISTDVTGSIKQYQVSSISEGEDQTLTIAALEYHNDKFQAVDRGWQVDPPNVTRLKFSDAVPPPTAVSVEVSPETAGTSSPTATTYITDSISSNKAVISWAAPLTSRTDTNGDALNTKYEYIRGYEIEHTFNKKLTKTDAYSLENVDGALTSVEIPNIRLGTYRARIRTKNTLGNYSKWVSVEGGTGTNLPSHPGARTYLIPTGGDLSTTLSLSSSTVSLGAGATQTYKFVNTIGNTLNVSSASAAKGTQNFNGMGANATAYLAIDHNVPDLKAVEVKQDTTTTSATSGVKTRFTYWKEVGASTNGLTAASGTVSITIGTTTVTGSSTNFDGEFEVGDFIKIGSGTTYHATSDYFRITKITSDTEMTVDAVSGRTYSGASAAYQTWRPDHTFDTIIAKVTTDSSTNYTLEPLCNYSASQIQKDDLASGIQTWSVRLTASKYAIAYDIDGGESDTIIMTASPQGIQGTATFKFDLDGTTKQSASQTATYTIANNDEPASGSAKVVKVTMYDDGVEKATDSVSVYGIQDGEDAVTVILTNEAHALPTDKDGAITYTNSGTDIKVFKGGTALAYGSGNNQFTVAAVGTNITPNASPTTVSTYTRRYGVANTCDNPTALITFTITVKNALGTATTFTKLQTFNKTVDGATGAAGRTVALTAATQAFTYLANGGTPSPSNSVLTATATNTTGTANFDFVLNDSSVQNGTTATYTYTPQASHSNMPDKMEVHLREGSTSGTIVARDQLDMIGVKPGTDGDDTITGFLTNAAHVVAADKDGGSYSLTGAGGTFKVFDGITNVTGANTTYAAGTSGTSLTETKNGLTMTITQSTGVYVLSGTASGWTSEEFTLRGTHDGIETTLVYSISKSKVGATGDDAVDLSISSSSNVFNFDNSTDSSPTPSTVTITATQSNQASNLANGDLAVTNGSKASFSYSGSSGTGSATWTVTPSGTYPVTCEVTNDSLTETIILTKVTGGDQGGIGPDGPTGAGTKVIYRNATLANKPGTPTADGLNIPSSPQQWSATPSTPSGTELQWMSIGVVAAGGTAYTWGIVIPNIIDKESISDLGFDKSDIGLGLVPNVNVITASVNQQAFVWTELSNAGFTPSATTFQFDITFKNASGTTVSVAKWIATRDTTNDHIDNSGITNNVSGSGTTSAVTGGDSTTMLVTFTNGGTSITVSASLLTFTGYTFKS